MWLPVDEDRWRAYLDTDDELVFYFPECAEREFRRAPSLGKSGGGSPSRA